MDRQGPYFQIDWQIVIIYAIIVLFGWLNIYAAVFDEYNTTSITSLSLNSGKQLLFIGVAVIAIILIMVIDFRFFDSFAWIFYILGILGLIFVLVSARNVNGATSWIELGPIKIQPSEFTKISTALALVKVMSSQNFKADKFMDIAKAVAIFSVPLLLIILQRDMGTAMVYFSFVIVLYREGMTPIPLILGFVFVVIFALTILFDKTWIMLGVFALTLIAIFLVRKKVRNIALVLLAGLIISSSVFSVDYVLEEVLQPHQRDRIVLVFNPNSDPLGKGWNLTQSKIAIGSGGFAGKGYLNGTQTKFDFVPEQSTDFIFCTIGEEHGFIGSFILISLFVWLILRIIHLAELQKWRFARSYGYCVAAILFAHLSINIGMTIGLFPVIGIPLPFISYGGSSLLSFTILLFIFIKFDSHRNQLLDRRS